MEKVTDARVNTVTGEVADSDLAKPRLVGAVEQRGLIDFGAKFIEIAAGWAWNGIRETLPFGSAPSTPLGEAGIALDDAELAQIQSNKSMADQLAALAELLAVADRKSTRLNSSHWE